MAYLTDCTFNELLVNVAAVFEFAVFFKVILPAVLKNCNFSERFKWKSVTKFEGFLNRSFELNCFFQNTSEMRTPLHHMSIPERRRKRWKVKLRTYRL